MTQENFDAPIVLAKRVFNSLNLHPYFDPSAKSIETSPNGTIVKTIGFKNSPVDQSKLLFQAKMDEDDVSSLQVIIIDDGVEKSKEVPVTHSLDSGLAPIRKFVAQNATFL